MRRRQSPSAAVLLSALALAFPSTAAAHVATVVGRLHVTTGWAEEPAYTGSRNSVEVVLSNGAGNPVTRTDGRLIVQVSFGDERVTLPLLPADGRPGVFLAAIVPTRPGRYAFHVVGRAAGQTIDTRFRCSEKTFDCVEDVSDIEFPARDPSNGELAARLSRGLPRAERAKDAADDAKGVGIAALSLAALALATSLVLGALVARRRA